MSFPDTYDQWLLPMCASRGIPADLFKALIWIESRFNPHAEGDDGAARGLCQMHPAACEDVGVSWNDMFSPRSAIEAGTLYFSAQLKRFKEPLFALVAWNQGPSVAERSSLSDPRFIAGLKYAAEVLKAEADAV